ncbi:MAG: DUF4349 domain-containing protein [Dehalococcoidia bacterium]|nr:DUF4349 domain-containing protein [Dehalococcoidia bacterium]
MKDNIYTANVEKKLTEHFAAEKNKLKAPSDMWSRIKPNLSGNEEKWYHHFFSRISKFIVQRRMFVTLAGSLAIIVVAITGLWIANEWGMGIPLRENQAGEVRPEQFATSGVVEGNTPMAAVKTLPDSETSGAAGKLVPVPPLPPNFTPTPPLSAVAPYAGTPGIAESSAELGILDKAERQIISTANVTIEVETVIQALEQIQAAVENVGGYVEEMNRSGEAGSGRAGITARVPQNRFTGFLTSMESLGKIVNQSVKTDDVTEQFIDLEARLNNLKLEEEHLNSLLGTTGTLSETLAVEKELTRVRADVEGTQGRLKYLNRRIELATIVINVFSPGD